MWNTTDVIIGIVMCLLLLALGAAIRYASRKWSRPLLVTLGLILVLFAVPSVTAVAKGTFLQTFKIRTLIHVCIILGALTADLIYRLRGK